MESQCMPNFEVEEFFPYREGFVLTGKCFDGSIRVGDVFVRAMKVVRNYDDAQPSILQKESLGDVCLKVIEIQYCREVVSELKNSYSGGIYVQGDGIKIVQKRCRLEINKALSD